MFSSKEEPYSGCVLISFWCDYDNKIMIIVTAQILSFGYAHWP